MTKTITSKVDISCGLIAVIKSKCGNGNCVCKASSQKLHGPYYVWTCIMDGIQNSCAIHLRGNGRRPPKGKGQLQKIAKKYVLLNKGLQNLRWSRKGA